MTSANILSRLIELTSNVTDAFTTALYVAQSDQRTLALREHLSLSPHVNAASCIPIGHGPIGQVARDKRPFHQEFINGQVPELPLYSRREEIKGVMAVPVMAQGLEGVLVVDTKEQFGFSTKQQKIVSSLAEQIAWHLSRERGGPSASPAGPRNFHEVVEWCRTLTEVEDRAALSDRIVQVPEGVSDCDAVAVLWFNGDAGRVLRFRGWEQELRPLEVQSGKGFAGSCAKNKKPFLMRNTSGRKVVVFSEEEEYEPWGSLLAVPILVGEHLHGMIVVARREPYALSEPDQDTWTLIAAFAGNALKCAEIQTQFALDDTHLDTIKTGAARSNYTNAKVPKLDMCVMNPPFVSSRYGNRLFGSLPEERAALQKELSKQAKKLGVSATAGLGALFVPLAEKHIKIGGRIAFVLPIALATGEAWGAIRRRIATGFHLEIVITSHDSERPNFSENTDLSSSHRFYC